MADSKVSQLTAATTPLAGTELVYLVQGGNSRRATAQAIADLASTDLSYDAATRLLSSSTGADVTLPVATASLPGLMAAADKALTDALIAAGVTAAGTVVTIPHIHGDLAGSVYIHVKNTSGGQLVKGTPVRVTGAVGDTTTLEVAAADATTAGTMPAIGILGDTLANNASGHAVVGGELTGLATGSYSIGQALYVAAGGGLTGVKPTTGTVQQVAIVGRVHASTGSVTVTIGAQLSPDWDTAYSERLRWDGSATGLDAATGRASLGLATVATTGAYADLTGKPTIPAAADAAPLALGAAAAIGTSTDYAREDHVHARPSASDIGAAASGAITGSGLTMATARLLGRTTASTGAVEQISVGSGLSLSGGTLSATVSGGLTHFVESESTASPNATVPVDALTATDASFANIDVAIVAKGTGATLAAVPDGTAVGGNKRGSYATDLQKNRSGGAARVASGLRSTVCGGDSNTASGTDSAALAGSYNTASGFAATCAAGASNTASGNYSFIGGGYTNTASSDYSFVGGGNGNIASSSSAVVAGGQNCTATGALACTVGGDANTATGGYSCILGGANNVADSQYSAVLGGRRGTTRGIIGYQVSASCSAPIAAVAGVTQSALLLLGRQTTDATPTVLASSSGAAGILNQVILPNNSAYSFSGEVIAGVTGAGDTARWTINGAIKRGASAATTAMVGTPTVTMTHNDAGASGWIVNVTADTTNGGIKVEVTGAASTTIRWVAKITTTEMTF